MSFKQIRCPATLRWRQPKALFNPLRNCAMRTSLRQETEISSFCMHLGKTQEGQKWQQRWPRPIVPVGQRDSH